MNWADTAKATARTVLAERTAATGRVAGDTLWTWNACDVWLSRVRPLGKTDAQASEVAPATQPRRDTARRD